MGKARIKLRVAIFANGIYPYRVGGMQKHTTCLTRYLAKAGVDVELYFIQDGSHPDGAQIHAEQFADSPAIRVIPVSYRRLPYFPGHYYFTCWWQSRFLAKAIQYSTNPVDFIFAQGYTGWAAMQFRRRSRCPLPPVGMHSHGIEALQEGRGIWFNLRSSFAPVWQRHNIRLADVNLSLGGTLDNVLVTAGAKSDTILPAYNGIDERWLCPVNEIRDCGDTVRFLFVGRDSSRKGIAELNSAITRMASNSRFEIHLAGAISTKRRVAASRVKYHGELRDEGQLRELYRTCDVLVCPSYSEGMPTVILEAMASGLAVIATDVGAVRVLVDRESGYLIPRKDPVALLEAMTAAMDEHLRAKKLAGRRRVEGFTWERVTRLFTDSLRRYLDTISHR